ncbi:MAG: hypothetical protein IPO52_14475 [Gemmatimonadetes bacterium]|nr:hypothetical protein [Gemmatimonadota bacterium]
MGAAFFRAAFAFGAGLAAGFPAGFAVLACFAGAAAFAALAAGFASGLGPLAGLVALVADVGHRLRRRRLERHGTNRREVDHADHRHPGRCRGPHRHGNGSPGRGAALPSASSTGAAFASGADRRCIANSIRCGDTVLIVAEEADVGDFGVVRLAQQLEEARHFEQHILGAVQCGHAGPHHLVTRRRRQFAKRTTEEMERLGQGQPTRLSDIRRRRCRGARRGARRSCALLTLPAPASTTPTATTPSPLLGGLAIGRCGLDGAYRRRRRNDRCRRRTTSATTARRAALLHRRGDRHTLAGRDVVLTVLLLDHLDEAACARLGDELREAIEAGVALVEVRVDLLHDLLEAIGAHDVALRRHLLHGLDHELPRIALRRRGVALLGQAREVGVREVLVAILDQDVGRRLTDTDPDDVLAVLLQLEHERREIAVTREQDEGADLGTREDELHRIDGEPDVGGVLLVGPEGGGEDQVDRGFRQRHDVLRVAAPVGIGALNGDLALDDVGVEEGAEFLGEVGTNAKGHIVEVDQQRRIGRVQGGYGHMPSGPKSGERSHDGPVCGRPRSCPPDPVTPSGGHRGVGAGNDRDGVRSVRRPNGARASDPQS